MTELRDVVDLRARCARPVGRMGGALATVPALELATTVLGALLERTGVDPAAIDGVIAAQGYPTMEAPAIGRVAALDAGFPVETTGYQLDRRCGSGLQAVLNAAMEVQTGVAEAVVALGVESMSNAPLYTVEGRRGVTGVGLLLHDALARGRETVGGRRFPTPDGNVGSAELLRAEYGISREAQDAFALQFAPAGRRRAGVGRVRRRARAGRGRRAGEGASSSTVTSIRAPTRRSRRSVGCAPILGRRDAEATVTAGNSSGQNDAAAACIVTTPSRAAELGLEPMLRLVSWAVAGNDPLRFGVAPVPAANLALERAGIRFADLDVIELNEAFAVQVLACLADWGLDAEDPRLNPRGSGISIGHPIGATGIRMLATLAHELPDLDGELALETMCIGGGQALAAVFARA